MAEQIFQGIELLPEAKAVKQLFILLHGVGAKSSDLVPLANKLRDAFPSAACVLPDGTFQFDGGGNGRQWFSMSGVTEENRAARIAGHCLRRRMGRCHPGARTRHLEMHP